MKGRPAICQWQVGAAGIAGEHLLAQSPRPLCEGETDVSSVTAWPTEIRLRRDRRAVVVSFDDGRQYELAAEYLRVLSPSAEVQGHSPEQRQTVGGKADVSVTAVDPVGNYAVRLTFSDGHNTGLFTWAYLHRLGEEHDKLWGEYLDELSQKGMSRTR
jgi:DUF971 family protein